MLPSRYRSVLFNLIDVVINSLIGDGLVDFTLRIDQLTGLNVDWLIDSLIDSFIQELTVKLIIQVESQLTA